MEWKKWPEEQPELFPMWNLDGEVSGYISPDLLVEAVPNEPTDADDNYARIVVAYYTCMEEMEEVEDDDEPEEAAAAWWVRELSEVGEESMEMVYHTVQRWMYLPDYVKSEGDNDG